MFEGINAAVDDRGHFIEHLFIPPGNGHVEREIAGGF